MRILLLALLAICATAAPQNPRVNISQIQSLNHWPLEWKFETSGEDGDNGLYVTLKLGTPPQVISVSLHDIQGTDDLLIGTAYDNNVGDFDQTKSSTWSSDGLATNNKNVIIGTKSLDVVQIDSVTFGNSLPFILQYPPFTYSSYLGLGPVQSDFTFLKSILQTSPDQTITLAFKRFPVSGVMTIGGTDKTRCFKDWRLMSEAVWQSATDADHPDRWGVAIDTLSVGKFSASSPGYVTFTLTDEPTLWPKDIYSSIIKQLGSIDGVTVPCDTTAEISFEIKDVTIVLKPDVYLDKDMQDVTGNCMLAGSTVDRSDEYRLPQAFFNTHCLSINHHTQQIGFATRRPEKS